MSYSTAMITGSLSTTRRRIAFSILFAGLMAFHMWTLARPAVTSDDVLLAVYALTGRVALQSFFHPPHLPYLWYLCDCGFKPVHEWLLKQALTVGGVNVWTLRIESVTAGLLALALMLREGLRYRLGLWMVILISVGWSDLFFLATHSSRSESLIWLFFAMNWVWLLEGRSRSAPIVGFLASLSLGCHPAAGVVFLPFPVLAVLAERHRERSLRLLWWLCGALAGFLVDAKIWNLGDAIQCVVLNVQIFGHQLVQDPPFIRFHAHLDELVTSLLSLITREANAKMSVAHLLWTSQMMAFAVLHLRRYSTLPFFSRFVLVTALSSTISYGLFTGSMTYSYLIYVWPWFYLLGGSALRLWWTRAWSLETDDLLILSGAPLLVVAATDQILRVLPCLFLYMWAVGVAFRTRRARVASVLFLAFLAVTYFDVFFIQSSTLLAFDLAKRRLWLIGMLCWPWILFRVSPRHLVEWRGIRASLNGRTVVVLSVLFLAGSLMEDGRLIALVNDTHSEEIKARAQSWEMSARVIGPMTLWFYRNDLVLQDPMQLFYLYDRGVSFDLAQRLQSYHASTVVLNNAQIKSLQADMALRGEPPLRMGAALPSPLEMFHEVHLSPFITGFVDPNDQAVQGCACAKS